MTIDTTMQTLAEARRLNARSRDLLEVWFAWVQGRTWKDVLAAAETAGNERRAAVARGALADIDVPTDDGAFLACSELARRFEGMRYQPLSAARAEGRSLADIAAGVGLSRQRVHQLLADAADRQVLADAGEATPGTCPRCGKPAAGTAAAPAIGGFCGGCVLACRDGVSPDHSCLVCQTLEEV